MKVRIRLGDLESFAALPDTPRRYAQAAAVLMTPAALAAYALGGWRIAADLNWTREFVIENGIFSHWQVWIALGAAIQATGMTLGRYGRGGNLDDRDATAS